MEGSHLPPRLPIIGSQSLAMWHHALLIFSANDQDTFSSHVERIANLGFWVKVSATFNLTPSAQTAEVWRNLNWSDTASAMLAT